eukprot:PhM_4_TR8241/c0_g1_i1/m.102179
MRRVRWMASSYLRTRSSCEAELSSFGSPDSGRSSPRWWASYGVPCTSAMACESSPSSSAMSSRSCWFFNFARWNSDSKMPVSSACASNSMRRCLLRSSSFVLRLVQASVFCTSTLSSSCSALLRFVHSPLLFFPLSMSSSSSLFLSSSWRWKASFSVSSSCWACRSATPRSCAISPCMMLFVDLRPAITSDCDNNFLSTDSSSCSFSCRSSTPKRSSLVIMFSCVTRLIFASASFSFLSRRLFFSATARTWSIWADDDMFFFCPPDISVSITSTCAARTSRCLESFSRDPLPPTVLPSSPSVCEPLSTSTCERASRSSET